MMVSLSIAFVLLLSIIDLNHYSAEDVTNTKINSLNIAVIGAGPSGLCSAKHAIAQGHKVTIYEQLDDVGGVWIYSDEVGKNKYGLNVHSSLYQELRLPLLTVSSCC